MAVLTAYLLGSIPTGFLVAKSRGIDIRQVGSGNIGATNVLRILGKPAGVFVLFCDALKGWLAVAIAAPIIRNWLAPDASFTVREWFGILAAFAAVLGHIYTCWLYFRGGKGIATSAGALLALVPTSLLIILIVWIIIVVLTRYASLASICASATLPIAAYATGESFTVIVILAIMAGLTIYKHKSNIRRLMNGTESRIEFKRKTVANHS